MKRLLAGFLAVGLVLGLSSAILAADRVYDLSMFEDPTTLNVFSALGPNSTVWNSQVASEIYFPTLFGLAAPTWEFVPAVAADMPSPFIKEQAGGKTLYTSIVKLRKDQKWSDGTPITADDFVFTANAVLEFDPDLIGGNWPSLYPKAALDHVAKVDDYTVKFYLTKVPGLSEWQYGVLQAPFVQKKFWEPVFANARKQPTPEARVKALLAFEPTRQPSGTAWMFGAWEKGAYYRNVQNPYYAGKGEVTTFYENGVVTIENPKSGYKWASGKPEGKVTLRLVEGPYVDSVLFRLYQNQNAAVLALTTGEVDFFLNSLGLQKGFQDQLRRTANVALVENHTNGFRFMAFNLRKYPFNIKQFRQAVATLIDREYVTQTIFQGIAFPLATPVPPGNEAWYNKDVKVFGQGMNRAERVAEAVRLLKSAGFSWQVEPQVDLAKGTVTRRGRGLIMPNGKLMEPFDFMIQTAGYDPLRNTFGIFITQWMQEIGIPVQAVPTEFNLISTKVFDEQDFDAFLMGWSLSIYPDYLAVFFHSNQAGPGGFNAPGYSNPAFDKLADQFLAETDINKAIQEAKQLQAILADELPYIVLFDTPMVEAYRSDRVQYPYLHVLGGLQFVKGLTTTVQLLQ